MGGKSGNVARLPLRERVRVDPVKMLQLRRDFGSTEATLLMERRVEDMTQTLIRMETLSHPAPTEAESERFRRMGLRLARLAAETGLVRVARVAETVVALSGSDDQIAFTAAWARLLRLCAALPGSEAGFLRGWR